MDENGLNFRPYWKFKIALERSWKKPREFLISTWFAIWNSGVQLSIRPEDRMLITKTCHDIPSALDNGKPIRIFIISPNVPGYPQAKFPGRSELAENSEITHLTRATQGVVCFSEIYQVTGPVERFAGQIASHGYVVGGSLNPSFSPVGPIDLTSACPSTYHEFEGPEPIPYDTEGKSNY